MAPAQSRKRKSAEMEETPQVATPEGSPAAKKMRITQTQKQALIDNLQLEVTERARQLRAHYSLQCADLRSRIERRVNRIPIAMRKMTMGELMKKHEPVKHTSPPKAPTMHNKVSRPSPTKPIPVQEQPLPALPQQPTIKSPSPIRPIHAAASKSKKRKSSEIHIASDKENDSVQSDSLPVTKNNKRAKPTTTTTQRPPSHSQKAAVASSILSPRSHNSRTLPRSPIKDLPPPPLSPTKSLIARPISPLKPQSPFKTVASAATSAISASVRNLGGKLTRTASTTTKGKMLPPPQPAASPQRTISQSSQHTDTSMTSESTVVTKAKRAVGRPAKAVVEIKETTTKKSTASKAASAAKTALKKTAGNSGVNKKVVVAEPASGKRVLRKRN